MHGLIFVPLDTNCECVSLIWPNVLACPLHSTSRQSSCVHLPVKPTSKSLFIRQLPLWHARYTVLYGPPEKKGARKILSSSLLSLSMTTDKQAEARRRENTQKKSKSKSKHSRGGSNPNATAPTHCAVSGTPAPLHSLAFRKIETLLTAIQPIDTKKDLALV